MFDKNLTLNDVDPEIANAISAENARQEAHIELIASENILHKLSWTHKAAK